MQFLIILLKTELVSEFQGLRLIFFREITKSFHLSHSSFWFYLSHGRSEFMIALYITMFGCMLMDTVWRSRVWLKLKPLWRFFIHLLSCLLRIFMNALHGFRTKLCEPIFLPPPTSSFVFLIRKGSAWYFLFYLLTHIIISIGYSFIFLKFCRNFTVATLALKPAWSLTAPFFFHWLNLLGEALLWSKNGWK